jgi:hypothetical protein
VDALDREPDAKRTRAIDMEQSASGRDEQRAQPLAAADRGMAHPLEQPGARVCGNRQHGVEQAVDILADPTERIVEVYGRPRY